MRKGLQEQFKKLGMVMKNPLRANDRGQYLERKLQETNELNAKESLLWREEENVRMEMKRYGSTTSKARPPATPMAAGTTEVLRTPRQRPGLHLGSPLGPPQVQELISC